jgi:hypothetical protein
LIEVDDVVNQGIVESFVVQMLTDEMIVGDVDGADKYFQHQSFLFVVIKHVISMHL